MPSNLEVAQRARLKPIAEIAAALGVDDGARLRVESRRASLGWIAISSRGASSISPCTRRVSVPPCQW